MPHRTRGAQRLAQVTLRDTAELARAVEASGMARDRLEAATRGLEYWKPVLYQTCSYQTIQKLVSGQQHAIGVRRAQALEEVLRVLPGTFFGPPLQNEQGRESFTDASATTDLTAAEHKASA